MYGPSTVVLKILQYILFPILQCPIYHLQEGYTLGILSSQELHDECILFVSRQVVDIKPFWAAMGLMARLLTLMACRDGDSSLSLGSVNVHGHSHGDLC